MLFGSDAMGHDDGDDAGGFGIVAQPTINETFKEVWAVGKRPGLAVVSLDGKLGSRWSAKTIGTPGVPFSRLDENIFQGPWHTLAAGHWRMKDHITLGEGRAHVRIVQALASPRACHDRRVLALEDNMPVACAMSKGRSPAPSLNFLCRRHSAASLDAGLVVSAPWCQTSVQPADDASRNRPEKARPTCSGSARANNGIEVSESHSRFRRVAH